MKDIKSAKARFHCFTFVCIAICASILISFGCGGGLLRGGGEDAPDSPTPPSAPIVLEGMPLSLMAAAANHQVTLVWDAVSGAASYRLYSANSPGLTKSPTDKAVATIIVEDLVDTNYLHAGLPNGILRCYAVEAIAADGAESGLSTEVCARPMPVLGETAVAPYTMRNTLSWNAMAGDVDSWNLHWRIGAGILNPDINPNIAVAEGTETIEGVSPPYPHSGLSNNNVLYCYVLEAVIGDVSEPQAEVCGTPYTIGELDYKEGDEKGFCYEWISDAELDSEGRIVVVGVDQCGGKNGKDEIVFAARLLADGTPDTSFGEDGYFRGDPVRLPVELYFAPKRGGAYNAWEKIGVALDNEGRTVIVAAFLDYNKDEGLGDDLYYLLWRLTPDGALDETFGNGGIAFVSEGDAYQEIVGHDAVVDGEGRMTVVGRFKNNLSLEGAIVWRLLADGTLDPEFNNRDKGLYGFVDILEPGYHQDALDVAIDPQGRLVVGGVGNLAAEEERGDYFFGMVWRLIVDEKAMTVELDQEFGGGKEGGWAQCMLVEDSYVDSIAIDAQGRILFAGAMPNEPFFGKYEFVIGRLTADGELDETFGEEGIVRYRGNEINDEYAADITVDASGKIVAVGMQRNRAVLRRLLENGSPDPTFGSGGVVTYTGGFGSDAAIRVMIDDMGRLILAGQSTNSEGEPLDMSIWRYK
ncbi:MAG: hypothetical protein JXA24_06465 [Proteobacteria bacterium]|nr:hypothetical protein [Pseudomonadota bacterium]